MRYNAFGQIARDDCGAACAVWLYDNVQLFQQPVTPGTQDPFEMATNPAGVVGRGTVLPDVVGGANEWAGAAGQWMGRLNGLLRGSEPWTPVDGYVGDIDRDGTAVTVSLDGMTLFCGDRVIPRGDSQGPLRVLDGLISYIDRGLVMVFDLRADKWLKVEQAGAGAAWPLAFRDASGRPWVMYGTDALGGVVHPLDDARTGHRYGVKKSIYKPEVLVTGQSARLGWSSDEGELFNHELEIPVLGQGMVPLLPDEAQPVPGPGPETPTPEPEPLAVTIHRYNPISCEVPFSVAVEYFATGINGKRCEIWLTLDGRQVVGSDAPAGTLTIDIAESGRYQLAAIVRCDGREATTGQERIIQALPPFVVPVPPLVAPIQTGRDGFTQAADESRRELSEDDGA